MIRESRGCGAGDSGCVFEVLYCRWIAFIAARLPLIPAIPAIWRQFKGDLAAGSGNLAAMLVFEQVQKCLNRGLRGFRDGWDFVGGF